MEVVLSVCNYYLFAAELFKIDLKFPAWKLENLMNFCLNRFMVYDWAEFQCNFL